MPSTGEHSHYQLTFAVLALGVISFALLQSLILPVLPLFETNLHTSQDSVTWLLTAYLLSASVFTPILGRVGDMVGKKKVFVWVLIAILIGSLVAAVATSLGVMIAARAIQGVGGGVLPLAFGIIRDEFPREKVAGAIGVIAALIAVGGGLGLVLAGPIVNALDYHWLFWIPSAVVAVAVVATYLVIPESSQRVPGKINWLAALLLSGWLIALLTAVSEAPAWGWGSGKVIGLIAASIALSCAWVALELRSAHPLIDMRMMRAPAVWTTNLVAVLFGFGLYSVMAFVPEFVQTPRSVGYGFGASIIGSGLMVLPMTVTMFIFGTLSGSLSFRFTARRVLITGAGIGIVSFLLMAFAHGAIWEVVIAMAVTGAGFGLALSAMSSIIVDAVPSHQTGVASGMNANIRTIGGSIGAAVVASIVTAKTLPSGSPAESGYTNGFLTLAVIAVLAAAAAVLIPKLNVQRDAHQQEQAAMAHAELALVAAGTLVGDESE